MIAKRINHRGQCQHAQTQGARRACRRAMVAAALAAPTTEEKTVSRYSIGYVPGRYSKATGQTGPQVEVVYDGNAEIYRTTAAGGAQDYITRREALDAATPTAPAASAAEPAMAPGWSKAAQRRAGTLPARDVVGDMLGRSSSAQPGTCHYTGLDLRDCDCC